MKFEGKVAVVVGAAQGIGAAIASALAADGAHVEAVDLNMEGASKTARGIEAAGGSAHARQLDVLDYAQVEAAVDDTVAKRGQIDFLITSVGGGKYTPLTEYTPELFDQQVRFNLYPVFNTARAVLPHMIERDSGRMLFFTSTTGGTPGLAGYGVGKAGVESLIKTLVAELAQTTSKVTVNALMPGTVDTPLTRGAFDALPNGTEMLEQMSSSIPHGLGTPEEVASSAVYILSEEARRVTGQVLALGSA